MSISDVTIQSEITRLNINFPGEEGFAPRGTGSVMLGVAEVARQSKIHVDIVLPLLHPQCLA